MATNLITQEVLEVAFYPAVNERTTQEALEVALFPNIKALVTEEALEAAYISLPRSLITQVVLEVGAVVASSDVKALVTQVALEAAYLEPPATGGGGGSGDGGVTGSVVVPVAGTGIITVHGLFPVNSGNQTPYLLIARADKNQVSMLDLYTPTTTKEVFWWSAPIDGSSSGDNKPDYRTKKKRFRRMRVYGDGSIPASGGGQVTFIADRGARVEVSPILPYQSDSTQGILILQETSPDLVGRQVEVVISITGTNIVLREMQLEFVVLN